jgi:hypothetical protein
MSSALRNALRIIRDVHSLDNSPHGRTIVRLVDGAFEKDAKIPHFDHAEVEIKAAADKSHFIRGLVAIAAITEGSKHEHSLAGTVYRTAKSFLDQGGVG